MINSTSTPQKLGNDADITMIDLDESLPMDDTPHGCDPDFEVGDVSLLSEDSFMENVVSKETWMERNT
jgi:hypothetical protein